MMHILFVCTGNVCRSPMAELLFHRYVPDSDIVVSSAGTHGLSNYCIDPYGADILRRVGVDSSGFRSRRLTKDIAMQADLLLCFDGGERESIVIDAPKTIRRTFMLTDFAAICLVTARQGVCSTADTPSDRLLSAIEAAPLLRPNLPRPEPIPDPYGRDVAAFEQTFGRIVAAFEDIAVLTQDIPAVESPAH